MSASNENREEDMSPPAENLLRRGLADYILEVDTADCPPLDDLSSYAQEAMPAADRASLQPHVVECPLCASTTADLRQAYRQIIVQHRGLGGWLGPLRAYLGFLSTDARRRWRSHSDLCDRCRRRTERLHTVFSPPLTAATGAAFAAVAFFAISTPKPGRAPIDSDSGGLHHDVPKGVPFPSVGMGQWPTSVSVLENYLYPTKNLDEIEKYWIKILEDHPDNLAAHEALARIYRRRAADASDPRRKAGWQERAQTESDRLSELAGKSAKRGPGAAKDGTP